MITFLRLRRILPKICHVGKVTINGKCTKISKIFNANTRSFMRRTSERLEAKLREKDLVPEGFNIIYRGGMDNYINLGYHGSTILITLGALAIYRVLFIDEEPIKFPIEINDRVIGIKNVTQLVIMYTSFFAMLGLLRYCCAKYVFRMYYNPNSNVCRVTQTGFLPGTIKTIEFAAGTVKKRQRRSIMPWLNALCTVDGQKILIFEHKFRTSADFSRLFDHE